MNYSMESGNGMWSWHRFTVKEELGKLTFSNTANFNAFYFLFCTILSLFSMIIVS